MLQRDLNLRGVSDNTHAILGSRDLRVKRDEWVMLLLGGGDWWDESTGMGYHDSSNVTLKIELDPEPAPPMSFKEVASGCSRVAKLVV